SEGDLLTLGRAIAPLRDEGVLIVATGMTYHNIGGILGRVADQANVSAEFDRWLWAALNGPDRETALAGWLQAPHASQCHPSPEHLQPLLVAAGAGHGEPVERIYNAPTLGNLQSAYRFGARAA
ncbi:MAG: dioxygenase, partial [Sphingomonas sp.]|nr:dioxygenase [Sphingomonas sp.]